MPSKKLVAKRSDTVLLLVVFPFVYATLGIVSYFTLGVIEPEWVFLIPFLAVFIIVLSTIIASFFWYIPYHTKDKPKKYFEKAGLVETARDYQFAKKLFYVMAAITILDFLWLPLVLYISRLTEQQLFIVEMIFFYFLAITPLPTVVLAIRFTLQHTRKDFGFYLARAYFAVSAQKEDSIEKFKYLRLALDTYNKFLERNLKLKIKDIMRIYSKIMSASADQKIIVRESIGKAFEEDKLELARQLAEISSLQDEEEFLIKERTILNQQFKDILTIIIPAIISIVGFIIAMLGRVGILGSRLAP